MRFDVVTLFPEMFNAVCCVGVTGRAYRQGLWTLHTWNPRDSTYDAHRTVDDRPYGGGPGMVMQAEPLAISVSAAQQLRTNAGLDHAPVVLLAPTGARFDQSHVQRMVDSTGVIFICGRYEGVDQRFIDAYVTEELSLGDFVLSGGEIAALAMIDAVVRFLPGILNNSDSVRFDSFRMEISGLLDSPHYTRPEVFYDIPVPDVLLSGNHAKIIVWRREQSLKLTHDRRPELIKRARLDGLLTPADEHYLSLC